MKYTRTLVVLLGITAMVFVSGCGGKDVDTTPQAPVAKAPDDLEVEVEGSVTPTGSIGSLTIGTGDAVGPGDQVRFDAVASGLAQGDSIQVDVLESGWTIPLQQVAGQRYTGTGTVPAGLVEGSYNVQARILDPQGQEIDTRLADSKLVVMGQCSAMQRQLGNMTIHFDLDRSDLTSSSRALLQQVAALLTSSGRSDLTVLVEGHCDERGTTEYNLALGQRRARSTMDYLVSLGALDGSKYQPKSFGEERPIDRRSNEEAWAKNRRADFKLTCSGN